MIFSPCAAPDGNDTDAGVAAALDDTVAADRRLDAAVNRIASDASHAQEVFENWTEDRVDHLLFDLARRFDGAAEVLGAIRVKETGMGDAHDKTVKNRFASTGVYNSLAGQVAQGALRVDSDRRVTELASPVGVIFAIVPVTNPVATAMFKTLIALKARNALILGCPQRATAVGRLTAGVIDDVLAAHGAPARLVQVPGELRGRSAARTLMTHPKVSLVLATGGSGLVKAAYSSGTPAI